MKFNRCVRCGSFFSSEDCICPNCQAKDEIDKLSIRNYLANNDTPESIELLSLQSGVSLKNVNRYLNTKEFSDIKNIFNDNNITSL